MRMTMPSSPAAVTFLRDLEAPIQALQASIEAVSDRDYQFEQQHR